VAAIPKTIHMSRSSNDACASDPQLADNIVTLLQLVCCTLVYCLTAGICGMATDGSAYAII